MEQTKTKPTSKKRKARAFPKGRQTNETALQEIKALINSPIKRDELIEYLHQIQDTFGCLTAAHLRALADIMNVPQIEVYEVASFYAHFDIVKENEPAPPPLTLRVCTSVTCAMKGANDLLNELQNALDPTEVRVLPAPCIGRCANAPALHLGHHSIDHATLEKTTTAIATGNTNPTIPDYQTLKAYKQAGGYTQLQAIKQGTLNANSIMKTLTEAGLQGLGGAGFPAGKKWQFVKSYPAPRFMTVNGDEGEPGTFKDRHCLETTPHQMLEGTLIAATACEVEKIYIYLRDEYPACREILTHEIQALEQANIINKDFIHLRRGAGAYICGEESAMIESIEGKRGLPRHRPPYIAESGLFNRPTLNHNIETLHWIPEILTKGAAWFKDQGLNNAKGLRSWSVSGWVNNPGVIVAPAGITAEQLIEKAGGMQKGHTFKAYLPGGASGGILPAKLANLPLDFGSLDKYDCFVGSHAIIILSDQDHLPSIAQNLLSFFHEESCGQCTPCRLGCEKALKLMQEKIWDKALLEELSTTMADASICGLGQAAPNPIKSILRHFKEEVS